MGALKVEATLPIKFLLLFSMGVYSQRIYLLPMEQILSFMSRSHCGRVCCLGKETGRFKSCFPGCFPGLTLLHSERPKSFGLSEYNRVKTAEKHEPVPINCKVHFFVVPLRCKS